MMYKKALKKNIPWFTLTGVSFTLAMGFFLAVSCVVLYTDFFLKDKQSTDESLSGDSYLILNKKVSMLNMFGANKPVFSQQEITRLKAQSFIEEVAKFEAAKFRIKAYAPVQDERSFYTDLFLEAVPSKFLDIEAGFKWNEGMPQLPVIVPRTYLNLYNFGFAPSQNLPQINEGTAASVSIKMVMEGPGGKHTFMAKIHDFTDRVNSLLVPEEFITWANQNIAQVEKGETSRVIIKSGNTTDPELAKFISDNDYSTNTELLEASKAASVFKVILSFEFLQGALILLLSLVLIILSTMLLVEKNKSLIYKLRLQSISAASITSFYSQYFIICSAVALLIALIFIFIFRGQYIALISGFGMMTSHSWVTILGISLVLFLVSSALAFFRIQGRVREIL